MLRFIVTYDYLCPFARNANEAVLSALAQTDGWILIKPESEGYPAHSEVVIRPWP